MIPESPETMEKLRRIRKDAVSRYGISCCEDAHQTVKEELGFEPVTGYFISRSGGKSEYNGHNWNYNPDTGNYIDLTARRFSRRLPRILIVPKDSPEAQEIYEVFTPL